MNQRFKCRPDEVYADYYSDYVNIDVKDGYNAELFELETEGYVVITKGICDIESICMVNGKYDEYCRILNITKKTDRLTQQRHVFEEHMGSHIVLDKICIDQMSRLNFNKNNSICEDVDVLSSILDCVSFILMNKDAILERELSIAVFGNSKVFGGGNGFAGYKSRICRLLLKYDDRFTDDFFEGIDDKDRDDAILAEYNISENPTYVYFKGNGFLEYNNGYRIEFNDSVPIAINSKTISDIEKLEIFDGDIMTVENLTSYNRLRSDDTFLLYLGGYNNKAKSDLLKLIYSFNADKKWFHFGDIDPDGFHILKNLINKTEIPFVPYNMGKEQLMKYDKYAKNFEKNDFQKAESLKSSDYADVVNYMFDTKRKLEQEIISWKEPVVKIL